MRGVENVDYYQGLMLRLGAYAGCLRCVEVCPVGNGYHRHLGEIHKAIPEETPEKRASLEAMLEAEMGASDIQGEMFSRRWLGSRGEQ